MRHLAAVATLSTLAFTSAASAGEWSLADSNAEFQRVDDRAVFVDLMEQGTLKRFGIRLKVEPDGSIQGRAFGRKVTGAWDWREGYFCRDLSWGQREIAANCQEVRVSGRFVRFTSDQGQGRYADLRID
ncbi:MAG: dihydrodipicolinate reductase [Pseudomonadota bacterium]